MKILAFLLALAPIAAFAQEAPLPANIQAMQQTIVKLTGESLQWQTEAIRLQAENADLKKQLSAAQEHVAKP